MSAKKKRRRRRKKSTKQRGKGLFSGITKTAVDRATRNLEKMAPALIDQATNNISTMAPKLIDHAINSAIDIPVNRVKNWKNRKMKEFDDSVLKIKNKIKKIGKF